MCIRDSDGCADGTLWGDDLLAQRHQVTLLEAGDYLGGHTHTVDVEVDGQRFPVDTGLSLIHI